MRLSPDWRPFNGPLSQQSASYGITVLGALFDRLLRQHYLAHNIFGALPRRASGTAAAEVDPDRLPDEKGRFLTQAQWAVLRSVLPGPGGDDVDLRARFAVLLAYTTGLRRSELADARIGRLKVELSEPDVDQDSGIDEPIRRVSLQVLGKGGKPRSVPIVPAAEQLLDSYLGSRGLPNWISCQQQGLNGVRLIGHLTTRRHRPEEGNSQPAGEGGLGDHSSASQALSDKMIYLIVGEALERAEQLMRKKGMNKDAETFARASTHWLRHMWMAARNRGKLPRLD